MTAKERAHLVLDWLLMAIEDAREEAARAEKNERTTRRESNSRWHKISEDHPPPLNMLILVRWAPPSEVEYGVHRLCREVSWANATPWQFIDPPEDL